MLASQIAEEIRHLVSRNRLKEAAILLSDTAFRDIGISLMRRIQELNHLSITGQQNMEDLNLAKNKISVALLEIASSLENPESHPLRLPDIEGIDETIVAPVHNSPGNRQNGNGEEVIRKSRIGLFLSIGIVFGIIGLSIFYGNAIFFSLPDNDSIIEKPSPEVVELLQSPARDSDIADSDSKNAPPSPQQNYDKHLHQPIVKDECESADSLYRRGDSLLITDQLWNAKKEYEKILSCSRLVDSSSIRIKAIELLLSGDELCRKDDSKAAQIEYEKGMKFLNPGFKFLGIRRKTACKLPKESSPKFSLEIESSPRVKMMMVIIDKKDTCFHQGDPTYIDGCKIDSGRHNITILNDIKKVILNKSLDFSTKMCRVYVRDPFDATVMPGKRQN